MAYLVDTNILLRRTNRTDPQHPLVARAIRILLRQGESLHYAHQTRRECWNVCRW
jgi:hypothetical protein